MPPPSILVVVLDDVGVRELGCYAEGTDIPPTPRIDLLAQEGVLFRHGWALPLCHVSRATFSTGLYPIHHGLGGIVENSTPGYPGLSRARRMIPHLLRQAGYKCAFFGKWHMASVRTVGGEPPKASAHGWPNHPGEHGYHHFVAHQSNVGIQEAGEDYFGWTESIDCQQRFVTGYLTSHMVDEALEWLEVVPDPFFAVVAFQSAHAPFHVPPQPLHTQGTPATQRGQFKAMVESIDTEIGRMLDSLGARLNGVRVVLFGDNGTPGAVLDAEAADQVAGNPASAKGTVLEGGVNVPLILSTPTTSPGAPGGPYPESPAMVTVTDLFATCAEIAGLDLAVYYPGMAFDSISFLPRLADPGGSHARQVNYTEFFEPPVEATCADPSTFSFWHQAARGGPGNRWKLIRTRPPLTDILNDLDANPWEKGGLVTPPPYTGDAASAFAELSAFMDGLCP